MFRESSAIDSERTAASVRSLYAKYSSAEDNWFNGTPDSVDSRIAQCKKISNLCRAASVRLSGRNASSQYIALAHEMDGDRKALEGLRRDLLTAATDRDDYEDYPPAPDGVDEEGLHRDREIDDLIAEGTPLPSEHPKGWNTSPPRRQQELERKEYRKENPYKYKDVRFMSNKQAGYFGDGQDNEWRDEGYYDDENKEAPKGGKHRAEDYKGKHRAEARYFIAEQECDDLRELTIRAQRHAERLSSTATPKASAAFVTSFVRAVRDEYQPPRQQRTASHATPQDFPAELIFLD
jgi:hypothetical protein